MLSSCPPKIELRDFAIGALASKRLEEIVRHVEACSDCADVLGQMDGYDDGFVRPLESLASESRSPADVPSAVLASARAAIEEHGVTSSNLNLDPGRRYAKRLMKGPCQLGRFELREELGDGGFGYVFRAIDPELDRTVAIKVQRMGSLADSEDHKRFAREVQSAAQLQHPNIVALYESGHTEDDVFFMVTEYVAGDTLESRLRDGGKFAPRDAASLAAVLAKTLNYAHDHDVVHRDIKPSNIILDDRGQPHITDFGLAKRLTKDQSVTSDGRVLGTPAYMSPEQARGDSHTVDGRSDIYSLGVVLYELLTGERPFQGNRRLVMQQVITDDPRPLRQLDDRIPKDLETICLKAISKAPLRRYQTAAELLEDLHRFLDGDSIQARPMGYGELARRWCYRNPIATSLLLAVTLGAIVGFGYLSYLSTYFVEQAALDSARSEAIMLEGIRDHYSEKLIDPLEPAIRQALPSPAPYLIQVGDYISHGKSGMKVQLYGLHPWRPRPPKDDFQLTALAVLKRRAAQGESDLAFERFVEEGGRRWLRYAKGQLMKDSCVKCHNDSKDSPKRDWKPGELVGILEVTRPLDREIERTRKGLRGAFLMMGGTGMLLGSLALGLVWATRQRQRRRWSL